jgi:flagellar assembly protein FliH
MSGSNVIPKETLTAWERWEMDSFAGDSRSANSVSLPTVQQLEDMQRQARQEGFEAGYRDGGARAQSEAQRLAQLIAGYERELEKLDEAVASTVLGLALAVARGLLRTAIEVQPELLLPALREAVAEIPAQSTHKRIQLHPEDAKVVRAHAADLAQSGGWQLVEDNTVARGGCRLRTGLGEIDATLETRWQRVLDSIGRDHAWLATATAADSDDD